jgi:hypothetical protein
MLNQRKTALNGFSTINPDNPIRACSQDELNRAALAESRRID